MSSAVTVFDVWNRPYNNTVVGDPDDLKPGEHFDYPVFKGFYSGVHWLELNTSEGPITAMTPASILQMHPVATCIIDEAAAAKLQRTEYYRWVYDRKPDWQKV